MRQYSVYKWVENDKIIYVGKSVNVEQRIQSERIDPKFKDHLDAKIFYTVLANKTEMDGLEKLLINKYQPMLNVIDRNDTSTNIKIDDDSLVWISFSEIEEEKKNKLQLKGLQSELVIENNEVLKCNAHMEIINLISGMVETGCAVKVFDIIPESIIQFVEKNGEKTTPDMDTNDSYSTGYIFECSPKLSSYNNNENKYSKQFYLELIGDTKSGWYAMSIDILDMMASFSSAIFKEEFDKTYYVYSLHREGYQSDAIEWLDYVYIRFEDKLIKTESKISELEIQIKELEEKITVTNNAA